MRIGFYTPFKPIIGGGEKYFLTLAEILSGQNEIELLSPFYYDLSHFSKMFGLDLKNIKFRKFSGKKAVYMPPLKKDYDLFFCMSNHLTPPVFSRGKQAFLLLQFPFPYRQKSLKDKLHKLLAAYKLRSYNFVLCYSAYVRNCINELIHHYKPIIILNPCIDYKKFTCENITKKKIILSVGRFFRKDHTKNFFQLITAFKTVKSKAKLWEYHIAGFVDEENRDYFTSLKKATVGWSITLHPNLNFNRLVDLYHQCAIFWHATGIANDERITPEKSEHFGLSVVEAMAAGNVPIVTNKGALPEIVEDQKSGYLFNDLEELIDLTERLIKNTKLRIKIALQAQDQAKKYDKAIFKKKLEKIIERL